MYKEGAAPSQKMVAGNLRTGLAVVMMSKSSDYNLMADDPITRHFFHGFICLHILYHAAILCFSRLIGS